ncbi:mRNA-capping enzyme-like protein isoform X2 [Tanacetum coccineum]
MGEVLYELGDREFSEDRVNRWLKDAQLTGYTGSYRDLLGEDEIVGITLSKQVFEDAALAVIRNKGEPLKWKHSLGITSLMISEPARFVPFKHVLSEKFIDGSEMLLAAEGKGKYDWAAYMPNYWSDFSKISFMMTRKAPEVAREGVEAAREGVEAATIREMKGLEKQLPRLPDFMD